MTKSTIRWQVQLFLLSILFSLLGNTRPTDTSYSTEALDRVQDSFIGARLVERVFVFPSDRLGSIPDIERLPRIELTHLASANRAFVSSIQY